MSSGLNASTATRICRLSVTTLQPTSWPRSSNSTKMRCVRLLKALASSNMRMERSVRCREGGHELDLEVVVLRRAARTEHLREDAVERGQLIHVREEDRTRRHVQPST